MQRQIKVKLQEIDESELEKQSLAHTFEIEERQNICNRKQFREALPSYEEYEAIEYRY